MGFLWRLDANAFSRTTLNAQNKLKWIQMKQVQLDWNDTLGYHKNLK